MRRCCTSSAGRGSRSRTTTRSGSVSPPATRSRCASATSGAPGRPSCSGDCGPGSCGWPPTCPTSAPATCSPQRRRRTVPDGFIVTAIKSFVLVNLVMGTFAIMTWFERRLIGRFQVRLGPNRVGPAGLLQPIADLGKLLRKQSVIPDGARPRLYLLAPFIALFCAIGAFGLMPFGGLATVPGTDIQFHLYMADSNVALLFVAALGSLGFYGLLIGGWASGSKYSLLGGMRAIAQLVSYEVAFTLAVIGVVIHAQSLSFITIANAQDRWTWYIVPQFLGFLVFAVAAVAESNRPPFDLTEADGEVV